MPALLKPLPLLPTLDEIAEQPASAGSLPPEILDALMMRCLTAQCAIAAALMARSKGSAPQSREQMSPEMPADDIMLKPTEAATMLRRKPRWLYRNKNKLPFVVQVSPRTILCSERGLRQWLKKQAS
jgi:hypothetical protein